MIDLRRPVSTYVELRRATSSYVDQKNMSNPIPSPSPATENHEPATEQLLPPSGPRPHPKLSHSNPFV
jgi:hypothetical protein